MYVIAAGLIVVSGWSGPAQEVRQPILKDQPLSKSGQEQGVEKGKRNTAPDDKSSVELLTAIRGIEAAIRDAIAKEDKTESERKEQREVEDLKAQKDMARWAKYMFFAAVASLILSAVGVGLILWNLIYARDLAKTSTEMAGHAALSTKAAIDAAEIAQRTLVITNRAWVATPELHLAQPLENGFPLKVQLRIDNIGREPGLGTQWLLVPSVVDYVTEGAGRANHVDFENKALDMLVDPEVGVVIWAQTKSDFWIPEQFTEEVMGGREIEAVLRRQKSLIVDTCVAYTTAGGTHKTWTRFFLRDVHGDSTTWRFNAWDSGCGAN